MTRISHIVKVRFTCWASFPRKRESSIHTGNCPEEYLDVCLHGNDVMQSSLKMKRAQQEACHWSNPSLRHGMSQSKICVSKPSSLFTDTANTHIRIGLIRKRLITRGGP